MTISEREFDALSILEEWITLSAHLRANGDRADGSDLNSITIERRVGALQARSRIALGMTQQYSSYRNPDREEEENA